MILILVIVAIVIANTITLSIDHYGISDSMSSQIAVANAVFSALFGLEMVLKLTGTWGTFLKKRLPRRRECLSRRRECLSLLDPLPRVSCLCSKTRGM